MIRGGDAATSTTEIPEVETTQSFPFSATSCSAPLSLSFSRISSQASSSARYLLSTPLASSTTYITSSSMAATGPLHPYSIPSGISFQASSATSYTAPSFAASPFTLTMQSFCRHPTASMASLLKRPSLRSVFFSQTSPSGLRTSHFSRERATWMEKCAPMPLAT